MSISKWLTITVLFLNENRTNGNIGHKRNIRGCYKLGSHHFLWIKLAGGSCGYNAHAFTHTLFISPTHAKIEAGRLAPMSYNFSHGLGNKENKNGTLRRRPICLPSHYYILIHTCTKFDLNPQEFLSITLLLGMTSDLWPLTSSCQNRISSALHQIRFHQLWSKSHLSFTS